MHFPVIQFFLHRSCDYHQMLHQAHFKAVPILLAMFQLQSLAVDILMQLLEIQIISSAERIFHTFSHQKFVKSWPACSWPTFFYLFLRCASGVCPIMAYLLHCQHFNNKRGWRWWKTIEWFNNWRENPEPMEETFLLYLHRSIESFK